MALVDAGVNSLGLKFIKMEAHMNIGAKDRKAFVDYYCGDCDYDSTEAAKRIGILPDRAAAYGRQMLRDARVSALLRERINAERVARNLTKEELLAELVEIAFADVNDVVQKWTGCCRYCHGQNFAYQWIGVDEYITAVDRAISLSLPTPDGSGGFGFNPQESAHPECPECAGEGVVHIWSQETAKLQGGARMLYNGIKMTKYGPEVVLRDRDKALDMINRIQGYYKDVIDLNVMKAPPLSAFYDETDPEPGT